MSEPIPTSLAFTEFRDAVRHAGPRAGLKYLNGLANYRYTGVFRFENGFAHSVFYFDRVNPEVESIPGIPEHATYCCFVRDTAGRFTTLDALIDDRLDSHPAREAVRAYCGIPVIDPEGVLLGTLCHFDEAARDPDALDFELLVQASSELARASGELRTPPAA